jgi:hypothetical protein
LQLDTGLSSELLNGGVLVDASGDTHLYSNTNVIYKFDSPLSFNRFTEVQFSFAYGEGIDKLKFCLYISSALIGCPSSCFEISRSATSPLTIPAAPMLSYQVVDVLYIGFVQEADNAVVGAFSTLRDMKVMEGRVTNAYENGKCTDPNSRQIGGPEREEKCVCTDGFISSGTAKILKNIDACVPCVETETCSLPMQALYPMEDFCARVSPFHSLI